MSVFFAVCAASALISALIAIGASRSCVRRSDETMRILSAISSERSKIAQHETAILDLHGRFQSLQGKFYAERKRQSEPPEEIDPPQPADVKARLRKQLGLVPGRRIT